MQINPEVAMQFAKKLYEAYGNHANWLNYQNLPMPIWEKLPPKIQAHWEAVASAARELLA